MHPAKKDFQDVTPRKTTHICFVTLWFLVQIETNKASLLFFLNAGLRNDMQLQPISLINNQAAEYK